MSENNRRTNSRLNRPSRKKKANTILNILIGIVLLLIVIVVVNIVTGDDTEKAKDEDTAISEESAAEEETTEESSESQTESDSDVADIESVEPELDEASLNDTEDTEQTEDVEESTENTEVITESSDDPNVESVIIDPSWTPIGTSQTGEHTSSYDTKSVDWAEKVQALAYAAGLDESNMYVKFIGNGGSPQKSIGTVTSKDGSEIYRINLEWVDGEGWKPTKKEVLKAVKDAS